MKASDIHVCDDWLSYRLKDLNAVHTASTTIREKQIWREVVSGLDSIAVQFDPARITPNEARDLFHEQLLKPQNAAIKSVKPIKIPICYDEEFAPERNEIAKKMKLSIEALMEWHSSLEFTVTMLGFMPGFAYLQCNDDIPDIGRLSKPRQNVEAGSIGIIGDQSCIYSFNSPGGWPIIGRTPYILFNPDKAQPALLQANQSVSFQPINRIEFDDISRKNRGREKR